MQSSLQFQDPRESFRMDRRHRQTGGRTESGGSRVRSRTFIAGNEQFHICKVDRLPVQDQIEITFAALRDFRGEIADGLIPVQIGISGFPESGGIVKEFAVRHLPAAALRPALIPAAGEPDGMDFGSPFAGQTEKKLETPHLIRNPDAENQILGIFFIAAAEINLLQAVDPGSNQL